MKKPVALAMLSGGLDSMLATKIIQEMGIEVKAINFYTGFCMIEQKRRLGLKDKKGGYIQNESLAAGANLSVPVDLVDISADYSEALLNPRHGYGSAMNPCIDCRIYMLKNAKKLIQEGQADFVVTGEVIGQRPMSQHLRALNIIEEESGLQGLIVRPLSAKVLAPTIPETKGWVKREQMYAIKGRGRKEQIALAQKFGIQNYPQPAGGCCLLTDQNFSERLKDYLNNEFITDKDLSAEKVILLRTGRHFRINKNLRIVVSRNEAESRLLEPYKQHGWAYSIPAGPGPLTITLGEPSSGEHEMIASITARYSDLRTQAKVEVLCSGHGRQDKLVVQPWTDEPHLEKMKI